MGLCKPSIYGSSAMTLEVLGRTLLLDMTSLDSLLTDILSQQCLSALNTPSRMPGSGWNEVLREAGVILE